VLYFLSNLCIMCSCIENCTKQVETRRMKLFLLDYISNISQIVQLSFRIPLFNSISITFLVVVNAYLPYQAGRAPHHQPRVII